jgi:hypothetical protein
MIVMGDEVVYQGGLARVVSVYESRKLVAILTDNQPRGFNVSPDHILVKLPLLEVETWVRLIEHLTGVSAMSGSEGMVVAVIGINQESYGIHQIYRCNFSARVDVLVYAQQIRRMRNNFR